MLNGHDHIGIASTIIDETLHARLLGVFGAYGIDPTEVYHNGKDPKDLPQTKSRIIFESENFKQNYPGLYDYYSRHRFENAEHELMSVHYRPLIKQTLMEAYPGYDDETYEALSWSGLQNTRAWNSLAQETRTKYNRLIDNYKV